MPINLLRFAINFRQTEKWQNKRRRLQQHCVFYHRVVSIESESAMPFVPNNRVRWQNEWNRNDFVLQFKKFVFFFQLWIEQRENISLERSLSTRRSSVQCRMRAHFWLQHLSVKSDFHVKNISLPQIVTSNEYRNLWPQKYWKIPYLSKTFVFVVAGDRANEKKVSAVAVVQENVEKRIDRQ